MDLWNFPLIRNENCSYTVLANAQAILDNDLLNLIEVSQDGKFRWQKKYSIEEYAEYN